MILKSDSRGAGASVQIDLVEPEYSTSVSGLNGVEVVDFSVVSLVEGSEHTLSGEVLQSARQAVLALEGSAEGKVIDSVTFEVRGDLGTAVQQLKREPGKGLFTGGVKLPQALAELGLIDEYEFVVHPRLAGHGPTLLAGLSKYIDLKLVSRLEFHSGAVAMRYEPKK